MAGGPFDCIEQLATPEACRVGRELVLNGTLLNDAGKARLAKSLDTELASVRPKLWNSARTILAPYLVFAGGGVRELLAHVLDVSIAGKISFQRRNARAGEHLIVRAIHLVLHERQRSMSSDWCRRGCHISSCNPAVGSKPADSSGPIGLGQDESHCPGNFNGARSRYCPAGRIP